MNVKVAENRFVDFLTKKQLKYTSQRRRILTEAFRNKGHFSADEILETSRKRDRSISKATLYRTLALLKDSGLLEEHDFGQGKKAYERLLGHAHHDHMICIKCQRILEFQSEPIEHIQEKISKRFGFKIVFHSHKLFGYCKNCVSR